MLNRPNNRHVIAALALAATLGMTCEMARAHDESKYPDFSGQWFRTYRGNPRYDQTKPLRKQEAPLTPEYQARFEASMKDQDIGGRVGGHHPADRVRQRDMPPRRVGKITGLGRHRRSAEQQQPS